MVQSAAERARRKVAAQRLGAVLVGAVAVGGTAALLLTGHRLLAGLSALVGMVALLAGTPAARRRRRARGLFAARFVDRAFDFCLLLPLAWVSRVTSVRVAVLALVALGASYVASYEHSRGESLGYRGSEAPGYRALRMGVMTAGLLTGWVEASLWGLCALTVAAGVVRAGNVARQHRRARAG